MTGVQTCALPIYLLIEIGERETANAAFWRAADRGCRHDVAPEPFGIDHQVAHDGEFQFLVSIAFIPALNRNVSPDPVFKSAAIVLAAWFRPSDLAGRAFGNSPRARGTPGVQRTHGLRHLATPKRNGEPGQAAVLMLSKPQVRLLSSVPRAVFLRLALRSPRWTFLFRLPGS